MSNESEMKRKLIAFDPGHGGAADIGARGKRSIESHLVLSFCSLLKSHAAVVFWSADFTMLRNTDRYMGLGERNQIAKRRGADLIISVHANASERHNQHGAVILHYPKNTITAAIADRIGAAVPYPIGSKVVVDESSLSLYPQAHGLLSAYKAPCVLVELGYLDNEDDEKALMNTTVMEAYRAAILSGIGRFLTFDM